MTSQSVNTFFASIFDSVPDTAKAERNIQITKIYFGFDGKGGSSMESTGQMYGLTRESVRQITRRVCRDIASVEGRDWSALDACLETIRELIPCSADYAEAALIEKGLIEEPFKVEGIINAGHAFKRCAKQFYITKHQDVRFIVSKKTESWPKAVMSVATKRVSHNGAVSLDDLSKTMKGLTKAHRDRFARNVIDSVDSAIWLDSEKTWAFFGEKGRNRFVSRIKKIFSVADSAHIQEIEDAIERSWRKNLRNESMVLPRPIMLSLIDKLDGLRVTEVDVVSVQDPALFTESLRPFEQKLYDLIRNSEGSQCREKALEDSLVKDLSEKHSFSMALNYSPVILKCRDKNGEQLRGLYTVIGAR